MDITKLLNNVTTVLINPALLLIFSVALAFFAWGVIQFLYALNVGGKDTEAGKQHMLWGLIGMFIMVAAGGIIKLIQGTVNSIH